MWPGAEKAHSWVSQDNPGTLDGMMSAHMMQHGAAGGGTWCDTGTLVQCSVCGRHAALCSGGYAHSTVWCNGGGGVA